MPFKNAAAPCDIMNSESAPSCPKRIDSLSSRSFCLNHSSYSRVADLKALAPHREYDDEIPYLGHGRYQCRHARYPR